MNSGGITFVPLGVEHVPLMRRWLQQAHWRQWWGDPDLELSYIVDMIEGRDTTEPYIFALDGEPLGYIQVWYVGEHQTEMWIADHPWLAELPSDAVGVDLSLGPAERLSQGIGSAVLRAFCERLLARGHRTIVIDPDPANTRAVRAYAKAGFGPVPHLAGRSGNDTLIMQFEQDPVNRT